jgi:hypothetical protein
VLASVSGQSHSPDPSGAGDELAVRAHLAQETRPTGTVARRAVAMMIGQFAVLECLAATSEQELA